MDEVIQKQIDALQKRVDTLFGVGEVKLIRTSKMSGQFVVVNNGQVAPL